MDAVRVLREQGGVWVYLLRQQDRFSQSSVPGLSRDSCLESSEYDSAGGSSGIHSGHSGSWNENDEAQHSSSSTSSKEGKNILRQQHQVELTPEHRKLQGSPRVGTESAKSTPSSKRTKPGSKDKTKGKIFISSLS